MKLLHLSDLHLGKRVNGFSMIEDQTYILEQILSVIDVEQPDGILIAGDIYDKAVPSEEAVRLFDLFLTRLAADKRQVLLISGNHDSPERLSFGGRLMDGSGIHIAPVYDGTVTPVTLCDAYGTVNIFPLPFIKPAHVRRYYPEENTETYTDALRVAIGHMVIPPDARNILMTHQFVAGAERSDSEERSVGGTDEVSASVFAPFDYVALGHIHGPQNIEAGRIRYCGTPLKYSFSEANHQKSATVVELYEKGRLTVRSVPLTPLRDMRQLRGTYAVLTLKSFYEGTDYPEAYTHITLTDEEDIPDAVNKLRVIYKNLMRLDYDNTRTRHQADFGDIAITGAQSPLSLFADFYRAQNGRDLSARQEERLKTLIEKIWEGSL